MVMLDLATTKSAIQTSKTNPSYNSTFTKTMMITGLELAKLARTTKISHD
jgi:hypothetical protein